MSWSKADLGRRVIAYLIDAVIASLPSVLLFPLQPLSSLLGAAYMLLRDVLFFELTKAEAWRHRSIGKRLVNLEVVCLDGTDLSWETSLKRNLPFALGTFAMWLPPLLGPLLTLAAAILLFVELVLVFSDARGRRLGDLWANTQVVASD